tara:strand:- start:56 stop:469 length:414 start_codon:yes stop_codon:yes gene_type:complete
MKLSELIKRGHDTALKWSECDEALVAVNETFGEPYDSARKALHNDLLVATSREVPLDTFKGKNNPLRFEDLKVLVVVKPSLIPAPHKKLEDVDARIERLERELKLARADRSSIIDKLKIKNHEFVISQISTQFRHIK